MRTWWVSRLELWHVQLMFFYDIVEHWFSDPNAAAGEGMPARGESKPGVVLEDEFAHNVGVIAFSPTPVVGGYSKIVQLPFDEADDLVGANVADI